MFETTSLKISPTPPKEATPPRDPVKGKEVAIVKEQGTLSQEELNNQIKELKRISDLKEQKDKSEQELRKMFNQAKPKAQAKKWTEHEAKKAKILEEYNHQISFRVDPLPIKVDSEIVDEMFKKMIYVIETRSDCIKARETVEKNLDNMG
ncbi:hypothetical protein Tco_1022118 [Tanacetum coccineum]